MNCEQIFEGLHFYVCLFGSSTFFMVEIDLLWICRCNTSLLIDYCQNNGEHKYILIDVGKTFREQVIRWFTFYKIPQVDSVSFHLICTFPFYHR